MFYYRSRNDKGVDFVLREGPRILHNLVIVTYNDKRTIEKDGYRIDVVPITEF